MRPTTTGRRVQGIGCLLFIALLAVGTACGGSGEKQPGDHGAAISGAPEASSGDGGQQQVIPSPLGTNGAVKRSPDVTFGRPPVPHLANRRPEPPPDTVSLEDLHRQGQTDVLR